MPIYDYRCNDCGTFSAMGKMSQASEPCQCPECGEWAERIISAPRLALMDSSTRNAYARNEKSAHEPVKARRSSCGCSGTHTCSSSSKANASSAKQEGNGLRMQTKKTARPWMLGH